MILSYTTTGGVRLKAENTSATDFHVTSHLTLHALAAGPPVLMWHGPLYDYVIQRGALTQGPWKEKEQGTGGGGGVRVGYGGALLQFPAVCRRRRTTATRRRNGGASFFEGEGT